MSEAQKTKKQEKPFVTGHCVQTVFFFFLIGCLVGTYWEEGLYFVQHHEYVLRTGTVLGPFSPIYGYGVAIFAIILGVGNEKRSLLSTYLISCLIGGIAEFVMSIIAEVVFHQVIWDYSDRFLNIMGRTTIPFMLGWGLGGLVLMKVIYPLIIKLCKKIPRRIGQPVFIVLVIFMAVNLFLTYGSLGRQAARGAGKPANDPVSVFFDKFYPEEYLKARFPAISFMSEEEARGAQQ